jgi:hypothetical protein
MVVAGTGGTGQNHDDARLWEIADCIATKFLDLDYIQSINPHVTEIDMNAIAALVALSLCVLSGNIQAETVFRCVQANGTTVYRELPCAYGTDLMNIRGYAVHIDAPPTDSLDNPEAAARYRMRQEIEAQQQAIQEQNQRQELKEQYDRSLIERSVRATEQTALEQQRHNQAMEQKTDALKKEMKRARIQQSMDAEIARNLQPIPQPRSMNCRPNGMGGFYCD